MTILVSEESSFYETVINYRDPQAYYSKYGQGVYVC